MTSPLLDLPGAVAGDGVDAPVAAHYGSFNLEQRALENGDGFVDLSHRDVVRVEGPDRLTWLHSLTTQHLESLEPGRHPARAGPRPAGPRRARVRRQRRRHGVHAAHRARPGRGARGVPRADEVHDARRAHRRDLVARRDLAAGARRGATSATSWCPRDQLASYAEAAGPAAGLWAFEALRIARGEPRFGVDTDARTIPNEVGWIGSAVHMDKGCYRGQETVARVHTLGRPPRRLTLLHLDGSENRLPAGRRRPAARREVGRLRRLLGPAPRARPDRAGAGQAQRRPRRRAPGRRHAGRPGGRGRPRGRAARAAAALSGSFPSSDPNGCLAGRD